MQTTATLLRGQLHAAILVVCFSPTAILGEAIGHSYVPP